MIIAVFGLPGSGKSYFARSLADQLNACYISSDQVRKDLFPSPSYTEKEKERVYRELYNNMYDFLHRRQPLVMDATFYRKDLREQFNLEAESIGCQIAWIEIRADDKLVRERLSLPRANSDADYEVHTLIKGSFQPMIEPHLVLHSSNTNLDDMLVKALEYVSKYKPRNEVLLRTKNAIP